MKIIVTTDEGELLDSIEDVTLADIAQERGLLSALSLGEG